MVKKISLVVIYLLLGVIFFFLYQQNNPTKIGFDLKSINPISFIILILMIFLSVLLRSLRISYLFPSLPNSLTRKKKFWIIFTSLPMSILIGSGGVLFRIILLKKRIGISYIASLSNVVLEKLLDLAMISLIIFLITFYLPQFKNYLFDQALVIMFTFVSIGLCLLMFFFRKPICYSIFFLIKKFPQNIQWKIKKKIFLLSRALEFLNRPKKIATFVTYSLVIWLVEINLYKTLFSSINIATSFMENLLINTVNLLFLLLPLAPSGIGVIQASFILSEKILALPYDMLVISIYFHSILLGSNFLFLLLGLHQLKLSFKGIKKIFFKK